MIESFATQGTEDIYCGEDTKAARQTLPVELWGRARELLDQLNAAMGPGDLRLPPSNRLHKLKGKLAGLWSVSINMKHRIVFQLAEARVTKVEILDYH